MIQRELYRYNELNDTERCLKTQRDLKIQWKMQKYRKKCSYANKYKDREVIKIEEDAEIQWTVQKYKERCKGRERYVYRMQHIEQQS